MTDRAWCATCSGDDAIATFPSGVSCSLHQVQRLILRIDNLHAQSSQSRVNPVQNKNHNLSIRVHTGRRIVLDANMGTPLKSPPFIFTLVQVRFNSVLKLSEYLPFSRRLCARMVFRTSWHETLWFSIWPYKTEDDSDNSKH